MDLPTRWRWHNKNQPWFRQVVRAAVEHYDTRDDALRAEFVAIKTERPIWNGTHNYPSPAERIAAGPKLGRRKQAETPASSEEWLSVAQAARRLGMFIDKVRELSDDGYLVTKRAPTPRGHGHRRILAKSVDELMRVMRLPAPQRADELAALVARNQAPVSR